MSLLFTLVIDHQGGTCLRQVRGASVGVAMTAWINELEEESPWRRPAMDETNQATPVEGMMNCWCASYLNMAGELVLIHLILTENDARAAQSQELPVNEVSVT